MSGLPLWALWPLSLTLVACSLSRGCGADFLARLDRRSGEVSFQTQVDRDWLTAPPGMELYMGNAVRTGHAAHAELSFNPDGRMRIEADTLIRFLEHPPTAATRLRVEQGEVEVESATRPLDVMTGRGLARVQEGSRIVVRSEKDQVQIRVLVGQVVALDSGEVATAGSLLTIELGKVEVDGPAPVVDRRETAGDLERDAFVPTPELHVEPPPPPTADSRIPGVSFPTDRQRFDFLLTEGGAIAVHDPSPPTRIAFQLSSCVGQAELQLKRRGRTDQVDNTGVTVAALAPGSYRYRHLCAADRASARSGTLLIAADPATQRLPKTAPSAQLQADGSRYTVRYQNLLPELRFHWPHAPASDRYHLEIGEGDGATRRLVSSVTPELKLPSGRLPEGDYRFRIVAAGGRSSPYSEVTVRFDNSARTAYISSPSDRGFTPLSPVTVRGAALSKSTVSAAGQALPLRADGRFSGVLSATETTLLIRVQHPMSGTHYYLRRPRATL